MTRKTMVLGLLLFLSTSVRAIEIVTISAVVTLTLAAWNVSKATYYYFWPSPQQLSRVKIADHQAEAVDVQKIFFPAW